MAIASSSFLAAFLVTLTAFLLLIAEDWRVQIGLLAAQYLGVFLLVALEWPMGLAAVKLIAGLIAGMVMGMAMVSLPARKIDAGSPAQPGWDAPGSKTSSKNRTGFGRLFFFFAATLVGMAIFSQVSLVTVWIPDIEPPQVWGGLILIGLGLLKLGFNLQPLAVTLGLLTVLSGFEIIYAALDATPLVAAMFGGVTLGLALVCAYLLVSPSVEEIEV